MPFDQNGNWIPYDYEWNRQIRGKAKQQTPNEISRRQQAPLVQADIAERAKSMTPSEMSRRQQAQGVQEHISTLNPPQSGGFFGGAKELALDALEQYEKVSKGVLNTYDKTLRPALDEAGNAMLNNPVGRGIAAGNPFLQNAIQGMSQRAPQTTIQNPLSAFQQGYKNPYQAKPGQVLFNENYTAGMNIPGMAQLVGIKQGLNTPSISELGGFGIDAALDPLNVPIFKGAQLAAKGIGKLLPELPKKVPTQTYTGPMDLVSEGPRQVEFLRRIPRSYPEGEFQPTSPVPYNAMNNQRSGIDNIIQQLQPTRQANDLPGQTLNQPRFPMNRPPEPVQPLLLEQGGRHLLPEPKPRYKLNDQPLLPTPPTNAGLLPEGNIKLRPNEGMSGTYRIKNAYDDQLREVYRIAEQRGLPPGREYETLQGIWSEIAPPNGVSFDELIRLSTKNTTVDQMVDAGRANMNTIRQNQVYGVNPNFKTGEMRGQTFVADGPELPKNKEPIARREALRSWFEKQEQAALNRIKSRGTRLNSLPLDDLADYAIVGASKVAKGLIRFSDWAEDMVKTFGDGIKPKLREIFEESHKMNGTKPDYGLLLEDAPAKGAREMNKDDFRYEFWKAMTPKMREEFEGIVQELSKSMNVEEAVKTAYEQVTKTNKGRKTLTKLVTDIREKNLLNEFDSDTWKDKAAIQYFRETMERNFEDVMGVDAHRMKKVFLDPIKKKEAERTRFIEDQRNSIRKLIEETGFKRGSREDELVQMYGEGKANGGIDLAELQRLAPNNWKEIKKAAETYRHKYDVLLEMANKILVQNGYKKVPKLENYLPHYEKMDSIWEQFGLKLGSEDLPTDISGITDRFKPGKNFFGNFMQRKGRMTDYGAIEGFDKYIEGISKVIYHTHNIKRLRNLERDVRLKYKGTNHLNKFTAALEDYINVLAGKKGKIDRALEQATGRNFFVVMDWVRRNVSVNMIGGNISSALTAPIQLTQAAGAIKKPALVKGFRDTMGNLLKNDGFVNQSDFLTRRYGSNRLVQTWVDHGINGLMKPMELMDRFTAHTIVRGKYHEGLDHGLNQQAALKYADDFAAKVMGDRSKGQKPAMFDNRTLGFISQFQFEVNNQFSYLFKDLPKEYNKGQLINVMTQIAVYSFLYNTLFEQLAGRKPALDPISMVWDSIKDFNNDSKSKGEAAWNTFERGAKQLPFSSLLLGDRIPVQEAIPNPKKILTEDEEIFDGDIVEELIKPLAMATLPIGLGQEIKTYKALTASGLNPIDQQAIPGVYDDKGKLKYPVDSKPIKSAIFGVGTFPETKEYYDSERRTLSEIQTKQVERSKDPKKTYEKIQFNRRMDTLLDKRKDVVRNRELTKDEKRKKIEGINELIQKLKKER